MSPGTIERPALERRSILIVAYTFPPRGGVGGLRPRRLARHLPKLGWQVAVLTPESPPDTGPPGSAEPAAADGVHVVRTPYVNRVARWRRWLSGGRLPSRSGPPADSPAPAEALPRRRGRLWLALRQLLLFPDEQVGWVRDAVAVGANLLESHRTSVILTTSPPETCHLIGARLKRRTGIPWVADFRDPWSFSHLRPPSGLGWLHRWAEARTMRSVDAIVTVSEGWARRFRRLYPRIPCLVIRNGYDGWPDGHGGERAAASGRFRIVYTGKLDVEQQDPAPFLDGLRSWLSRFPRTAGEVEVVFYGYGDGVAEVKRVLAAAGLPQVRFGGGLDHEGAIAAQSEASLLLLFAWRRDGDCIPAKLFDYLAAQRPILVIGEPQGEAARLVLEAGAGRVAASSAEVDRMLESLYDEWRGRESGSPAPSDILTAHDFARRAADFDRLLSDLAARSAN